MVGWRKSGNSIPYEVALRKHAEKWSASALDCLAMGLTETHPSDRKALSGTLRAVMTGPTPIFGNNKTQDKQNSDDDDEEDDDYDDDDVPMMMMVVVIRNIYFVLSLAVS